MTAGRAERDRGIDPGGGEGDLSNAGIWQISHLGRYQVVRLMGERKYFLGRRERRRKRTPWILHSRKFITSHIQNG